MNSAMKHTCEVEIYQPTSQLYPHNGSPNNILDLLAECREHEKRIATLENELARLSLEMEVLKTWAGKTRRQGGGTARKKIRDACMELTVKYDWIAFICRSVDLLTLDGKGEDTAKFLGPMLERELAEEDRLCLDILRMLLERQGPGMEWKSVQTETENASPAADEEAGILAWIKNNPQAWKEKRMRREKIRNIAEKLGCKYDSIVQAVRAFDYTAMSESPSITEDELSLLLENDIQEEKKLSAELLDSLLKDRVRKQV